MAETMTSVKRSNWYPLGEILAATRRHPLPFWAVFLFVLLGGLSYKVVVRPTFGAVSQILVEAPTPSELNPNDAINQVSLPAQNIDLATQIEVLQSSTMLLRAVEGFIDVKDLTPRDPLVLVEAVKGTSVLAVTVESHRRDLAENVARQLPVVYGNYLEKSQESEVDNALAFLTDQYANKRLELTRAENKLDSFQAHRPLVALAQEEQERSNVVLTAQQQAAGAEASLAAAAERLKSLQQALAALPKNLSSPGKQSNSLEIQAQRQVIAGLKAKRDSLAVTYQEGSRMLREADAEIARQEKFLASMPDARDSSGEELHPEVLQLDQQIADAQAAVKAAKASRDRLAAYSLKSESVLRDFQKLEPILRDLNTEVADKKAALDSMDRAIQQLRLRRNSVKNPVTVLVPPSEANLVRPKWTVVMAVSTLLGLLAGSGLCLVIDLRGDKLVSVDQIVEVAALPRLAEIPMLPSRSAQLETTLERSPVLESYRLLRFNLLFSVTDGMHAMVVTSSTNGEGKTELACNLAMSLADVNRRVILVDANLRHPSIHQRMGIAGKPGMSDVLLGESTLEECLHETSVPGLRVLTAGSSIDSPGDLLSSSRAKDLRDELLSISDVLIFDAPAVLGHADAIVLSSLAGAVLYTVRLGHTKRRDLRQGIDVLEHARARVLGLVVASSVRRHEAGSGLS